MRTSQLFFITTIMAAFTDQPLGLVCFHAAFFFIFTLCDLYALWSKHHPTTGDEKN